MAKGVGVKLKLIEMSKEYRKSGELCRGRVREIKAELERGNAKGGEKLVLQRRLTVLSAMARDTIELSNKLRRYYAVRREEDYDGE